MSEGEASYNTNQNLLEIQQGIHRYNTVSNDGTNRPRIR